MHINRLILFAGPPCSGKSTIVEKLLLGDLIKLSDSLRLGHPLSWTYVLAFKVHQLPDSEMDKVILHYDILRQWKEKLHDHGYEDDYPLSLLNSSDEITIVTLWAPAEVLSRRLKLRQGRYFFRSLSLLDHKGLLKSRRAFQVNRLFTNPGALHIQYERWFNFCESCDPRENWILDTTKDNPELMAAGQRSKLDRYALSSL